FPFQSVIICHPALRGRKQSSSDILYGPSRLGRNQDVLLGAGMIVSALAAPLRFLTGGDQKNTVLCDHRATSESSKQAPKDSRASHR
ncbi:hypothetical protein KUCAC02_019612, partial [Chaenocephalus aceratus]